MSLCNLTIQKLEGKGYDCVTGFCPVAGCGLPVARHRDENAPIAVYRQKEKDTVITGIYERLKENDTEPEVDSFVTFGTLTLLVRQEWIDLKNNLLTEREDKRHKTIFLKGTSGRGKSSFVYYLMYCILIRAKETRKRKVDQENASLVFFVRNEGSIEVKFLLTLSGAERVNSRPFDVPYYIADIKGDENRTYLGQLMTMVVASDNGGKSEFLKRVKETSGKIFVILSPTREQMYSIFKASLPNDEIYFRLDIVGCNPRELGNAGNKNFKVNEY